MTYLRQSNERGFTEIDWLKSKHTFSFGDYYSREHHGYESLRVINEDWIAPGRGFGAHPHKDMEILTYVVSGEVKHKDSTGQEGSIRSGELQLMRAGMGIVHSEKNGSTKDELHLLQIWIHPDKKGLDPLYQQANFSESLDKGEWTLLASPDARHHSLSIHQNVELWAKRFAQAEVVKKNFAPPNTSVWVQVVKGEVSVDGTKLESGDGLGFKSQNEIVIDAKVGTEVLFFVFGKND